MLSLQEMIEQTRRNHVMEDFQEEVSEIPKNIPELEPYIEAMANGDTASISFTTAMPNGDLSVTDDNGVRIIMRNRDVIGFKYDTKQRSEYIGVAYNVSILEINRKERIVYVATKKSIEYSKQLYSVNEQIGKELEKCKAEGTYCILPAKVISVSGDKHISGPRDEVRVNILGAGIIGVIPISEWSCEFIKNLHKAAQVDKWYNVEVVVPYTRNGRKKPFTWRCSRVHIAESAWKDNLKTLYPERSVVEVECIERPKDTTNHYKSYFWGKVKGLDGIDIMCDYPSSKRNVEIVVGNHYKCVVREVDVEKHIFKVATIENMSISVNNFLFRSPRRNKKGNKNRDAQNDIMQSGTSADSTAERNTDVQEMNVNAEKEQPILENDTSEEV